MLLFYIIVVKGGGYHEFQRSEKDNLVHWLSFSRSGFSSSLLLRRQ